MNIFMFLGSVCLLLPYITKSISCDSYSTESECATDSSCKWTISTNKCRCASNVKLDILFAIDTSGSIGIENWPNYKQFFSKLATQGISEETRIGFTMFSTEVNDSRGIQFWDQTALQDYVDHIYWSTGWTNTHGLLDSAFTEFENTKQSDRKQILLMLTDGNPCLPTGCPMNVCDDTVIPYYPDIFNNADIRVIIVGISDGINRYLVDCLTESGDYIPVWSFAADDFNSIMDDLSDALCPVLDMKEMKVTEVKAEKKVSGWNNRWGRFIEIYNTGIDFNANEITLSGLVQGTGPNVNILQSQYVIFYDASDTTYGGIPSVPTCHLCGSTCDLSACSSVIKGVSTSAGYCLCGNAVYIACGNSGDGSCSSANLPNGVQDACTTCTFQDSHSRIDFDVMINDTAGGYLIDDVVYGSGAWITTMDGYSYELLSKAFSNDNGFNWAQSCAVFGTPGADPDATCPQMCSIGSCGVGGSCNTTTGFCDCDTGYYRQCNDPSSCTNCIQVPTQFPTKAPSTSDPSISPTEIPTTDDPSKTPTKVPTTADPSKSPTKVPTTAYPSISPTEIPTTADPSKSPTEIATTDDPSKSPTKAPTTSDPSKSPTKVPTIDDPSKSPTEVPTTDDPSKVPTKVPTIDDPSKSPTKIPTTADPSKVPTKIPTTDDPSKSPAEVPTTADPSISPTEIATTDDPSKSPTEVPTTDDPSKAPTKVPTTADPSKVPTKIPTTDDPSISPTNTVNTPYPTKAPYTSDPSISPTTATLQPTSTPTNDFMECIKEVSLWNGEGNMSIDIYIIGKEMRITLRGPSDKWFGIGFGNDVMSDTYAITVSANNMDIKQRKLGNGNGGNNAYEVDTFDSKEGVDNASYRKVTIIRHWKVIGYDDIYDFTDFFECKIKVLKIIWAFGMDLNFGYHGPNNTNRSIELISCVCKDETTTSNPTNDVTTGNPTTDAVTPSPTHTPSENVQIDNTNYVKASFGIAFASFFIMFAL